MFRTSLHTTPLILFLLIFFTQELNGQDNHLVVYEKSLSINNGGMMVLGGWAVANLVTGAAGWSRSSGSGKYFHQMNFFWNTVNLSIAGLALYSNLTSDYASWDTDLILDKQLKTQRLFLINAGLDIGYMGAGLLLRNLSPKYPRNQERLLGYGNSVLVQGGFLFVFDLVMYGIQRSHRLEFLDQISLVPMQDAYGIALLMNF